MIVILCIGIFGVMFLVLFLYIMLKELFFSFWISLIFFFGNFYLLVIYIVIMKIMIIVMVVWVGIFIWFIEILFKRETYAIYRDIFYWLFVFRFSELIKDSIGIIEVVRVFL